MKKEVKSEFLKLYEDLKLKIAKLLVYLLTPYMFL